MDISRRDALKAGVGVGTFALAARIGAYESIVRAQAQANEPRLQLGSDYFFDDEGDELVISHDIQGDIFRYDPTTDKISTLKPLSSLITDERTVNNFGASAVLSAGQSIPSGTTTTVEFDSTEYDDVNAFDTINHKYVIPTAGKYLITAAGRLDVLAEGDRLILAIQANGTSVIEAFVYGTSAPDKDISYPVSKVMELSANDEITMIVNQDTDVSRTLLSNNRNTYMTVGRVA